MRTTRPGSLWLAGILFAGVGISGAAEPLTGHTFQLAAGEAAPAATLEDVAWFVGSWNGECFEQKCEEVWNPPSAGTMVGMYKLYGDDGVQFYELMLLTVEDGRLQMKVKHFSAEFSAWEDKDDFVSFPLVAIEPDAVHFRGLSFYRNGADAIDIWIALRRDGELREHRLAYRRAGTTIDD